MTSDTQSRYLSFGDFQLDCRSGELRKKGREIRLQPQPAKLLVLLATRPGEIVTREEIQKALWGADTFVDFEHGINFSIKQIREALGESADNPRYVETVPRTGYRFIAPLDGEAPVERKSLRFGAATASLVGLAGVLVLLFLGYNAPSDVRAPRFQLSVPRGVSILPSHLTNPAISQDGSKMAFVGCDSSAGAEAEVNCMLYLRDQKDIDARPIAGSEDGRCPFFSPDGRWIAFGANGKLKKIDLVHGAVVTLADAPQFRGGSWGEDGTILFSGGLFRVPAEGKVVEELTKLDLERDEYDHRWPHILPGGRAALVGVASQIGFRHDIAVVNLDRGTKRILVEDAGCPKYVEGHLLFGRLGIVYAAPFDVERLELTAVPVPVLEDVAMWNSPGTRGNAAGGVAYDVSPEGALLFLPRRSRLPERTLVLVDREGRRKPVSRSRRTYSEPRFSPSGPLVAVTVERDGPWVSFVADTTSEAWTRVGGDDQVPEAWMADGRHLLLRGFPSPSGEFVLLLASIDGTVPTRTLYVGEVGFPAVAPDGKSVLFGVQVGPSTWDLWRLSLAEPGYPEPWLVTPDDDNAPSFSPDGRWVAYESDDSGREEVYVRAYSGSGGRHRLSVQGGAVPRWSRDGKEIFFESNRSLWSVAVRTQPTFSSDRPQKLFEVPDEILGGRGFFDVSPDGQHFAMVEKDPLELRPLDLVVVPNWGEEMKARLAAAK